MFSNLGMTELLLIAGIVLLLFGNRLPGLGKALGQSIRSFKKGLNGSEEAESNPTAQAKVQQTSQPKNALPQENQATPRSRNVIDIKVED